MLPLFAPLVFSRTIDVDFRFLAIPEDFSSADMEWAQKYILSTLLSSYELEQNPRWSLFSNSKYHIIGLSCRASHLSERNTKDKFGRGLYLFVGYVAKNTMYIPMQPHVFQPLYQFVHDKWKDDTKDARKFIKKGYEIPIDNNFQKSNEQFKFEANIENNRVLVHSTRKNQALWNFFSQFPHPSSLCLNILSQKDAKEGIFLNVSTIDYQGENPLDISRVPVNYQEKSEKTQTKKAQTEKPVKPQSEVPINRLETHSESFVDDLLRMPKKVIKEIFNLVDSEPPKKDAQAKKHMEKGPVIEKGTQVEGSIKKEQVIDKDEPTPPYGGRYID
jgi:hypothetical protein